MEPITKTMSSSKSYHLYQSLLKNAKNGFVRYNWVLMILLCFSYHLMAKEKGLWNTERLYQTPKWEEVKIANKPGMRSILYDSIPYHKKRTQVFAYYGTPKGQVPESGWPAVVCVHGGGGTAFDAWVKKWNEKGYAAISMDLEGHLPLKTGKKAKGSRLKTPHPGPSRKGVFNDYEKPIDEQWYYHAVAQITLAHSLLLSFEEVNQHKTGIVGVSWGGTLCSTTIGIDSRFKFAIPAYGCGFLSDSSGHQGQAITSGKKSEFVNQHYDAKKYLNRVNIPVFWINGTNDAHFDMPAISIFDHSTLRFELNMGHGHQAIWRLPEVYAFADSVIGKKTSLLKVKVPLVSRGDVHCKVDRPEIIDGVKLIYTTMNSERWEKRIWKSSNAILKKNQLHAELPENTKVCYFYITDQKGYSVSSPYIEM
jgi:dienelactone hydrolase